MKLREALVAFSESRKLVWWAVFAYSVAFIAAVYAIWPYEWWPLS